MKPYLLFFPNKSELTAVSSALQFCLKCQGIIQIPDCVSKQDQLKAYLDAQDQLRMMVCDVTAPGILPLLEQLRSLNRQMSLVLLADNTLPPTRYIRPTIMPSSLLWRPVDRDAAAATLREVVVSLPKEDAGAEEQDQAFCLEVRGVVKRFDYRQILFFEARNKRVYLHHGRQEYPFGATLERLCEELPEEFIRVHKSFIINRGCVAEIQFGQNLVVMEGGIAVPISRSYRAALKAVFT